MERVVDLLEAAVRARAEAATSDVDDPFEQGRRVRGDVLRYRKAVSRAREAMAADKLVGAWGEAVAVVARAGGLRKRKVTGAPEVRQAVEAAGGRYTGTQVVRDGNLVTAFDDAAGFRFGKALAQVVAI